MINYIEQILFSVLLTKREKEREKNCFTRTNTDHIFNNVHIVLSKLYI